jgi:hypothetical protein
MLSLLEIECKQALAYLKQVSWWSLGGFADPRQAQRKRTIFKVVKARAACILMSTSAYLSLCVWNLRIWERQEILLAFHYFLFYLFFLWKFFSNNVSLSLSLTHTHTLTQTFNIQSFSLFLSHSLFFSFSYISTTSLSVSCTLSSFSPLSLSFETLFSPSLHN